MPLNPREQVFVSQYLIDLNGKRAAIAAGYKPNAAESSAVRILRRPHVQEAVAAAQAVAMVQAQIKAEDVLKGLAAIGFADITDYLTESGRLKDISAWPKDAGKLIAAVKTKRVVEKHGEDEQVAEVLEIKLWDKVSALDKLAKHFGLLIEQREVKVEHRFAAMTDHELDAYIEEALKVGAIKATKGLN